MTSQRTRSESERGPHPSRPGPRCAFLSLDCRQQACRCPFSWPPPPLQGHTHSSAKATHTRICGSNALTPRIQRPDPQSQMPATADMMSKASSQSDRPHHQRVGHRSDPPPLAPLLQAFPRGAGAFGRPPRHGAHAERQGDGAIQGDLLHRPQRQRRI